MKRKKTLEEKRKNELSVQNETTKNDKLIREEV